MTFDATDGHQLVGRVHRATGSPPSSPQSQSTHDVADGGASRLPDTGERGRRGTDPVVVPHQVHPRLALGPGPERSAALDPSGLAVQVEAGQGRRAGRNPVHQSTNRRTGRSPRLQGQAEVSLTDR